MHVVLVTGGRKYSSYKVVRLALDTIHKKEKITLLVHGGATGADSLAARWADENGVQTCVFPVTNGQWRKTGKLAGPRRNHVMLDFCNPCLVVAFPGGSGTDGCVNAAKKMKIPVEDRR